MIAAVDLVDRANFDAGALQIDDEHRNTCVLRLVRVGSSDDDSVVRDMSEGGPDLLTIEDPLVAISFSLGLKACHVTASAGFREHLAPDRLR